jgi:hypothetical protein
MLLASGHWPLASGRWLFAKLEAVVYCLGIKYLPEASSQ